MVISDSTWKLRRHGMPSWAVNASRPRRLEVGRSADRIRARELHQAWRVQARSVVTRLRHRIRRRSSQSVRACSNFFRGSRDEVPPHADRLRKRRTADEQHACPGVARGSWPPTAWCQGRPATRSARCSPSSVQSPLITQHHGVFVSRLERNVQPLTRVHPHIRAQQRRVVQCRECGASSVPANACTIPPGRSTAGTSATFTNPGAA